VCRFNSNAQPSESQSYLFKLLRLLFPFTCIPRNVSYAQTTDTVAKTSVGTISFFLVYFLRCKQINVIFCHPSLPHVTVNGGGWTAPRVDAATSPTAVCRPKSKHSIEGARLSSTEFLVTVLMMIKVFWCVMCCRLVVSFVLGVKLHKKIWVVWTKKESHVGSNTSVENLWHRRTLGHAELNRPLFVATKSLITSLGRQPRHFKF
jgi:hypothetical protein